LSYRVEGRSLAQLVYQGQAQKWRVYYHNRLIATQAAATGAPCQSLRRRKYLRGPSLNTDIFIEQLH